LLGVAAKALEIPLGFAEARRGDFGFERRRVGLLARFACPAAVARLRLGRGRRPARRRRHPDERVEPLRLQLLGQAPLAQQRPAFVGRGPGVQRLRDPLEGRVGGWVPSCFQEVGRLGAQLPDSVSLGAARRLERLLVSPADRIPLRLLELLSRAEKATEVDLPAPRELVHRPRWNGRLFQLLDRRVAELLRELVASGGELLQRELVELVDLVGHAVIVANVCQAVAVRALFAAAVAVAALLLVPTAPAAIAPLSWCGNDVAQTDRPHDRMGGEQIHVIYAVPADGPERFAELASPLATDVAAIDAWWRREDPTRAPRFDLFEFPGCETRFGNLDLSFVRLPDRASVYAPTLDRFQRVATQLGTTPFDFGAPDKKYLVFFDGAVVDDRVCGTGSGGPLSGGRLSYAFVYLRSSCNLTIGDGGGAAYVGAHELLHALGALPPGAPNPCPRDDGHPCDSPNDILSTFYRGGPIDDAILDVNHDDYYGHSGFWFDLQDSRWLLDVAAQVQLNLSVSGSGMVRSGLNGQECDTSCITEWDAGTSLELVADAAPGFGFASWTGACAGTSDLCFVNLGAATEAGAVFRPLRRVVLKVTGRGTVTGPDMRCSRACSTQAVEGARVVLRAKPARGWRFVRWSGACRGTRPACSPQLGPDGLTAAAVFARRP
jgi:hypothetical protein